MKAKNPRLPLEPNPADPVTPVISIPAYVDTWDDYFMYIAVAVSIKSKDPRCPVGALITSPDHLVLSTGFNGLARGLNDDENILRDVDEKLRIICHAEYNAIINAARMGAHPLEGMSIYVTKFPCFSCCNTIVQSEIKRLYTHDHEFWKDDPVDGDGSRKIRLLHDARIEIVAPYHAHYKPAKQITVPKKPPARETIAGAIEKRLERA